MFFSKKVNVDKIGELEKRVASLEKEVEFYKEAASFSQEEMLIILDNNKALLFQNEKASATIQDPHMLRTRAFPWKKHDRAKRLYRQSRIQTYEKYRCYTL